MSKNVFLKIIEKFSNKNIFIIAIKKILFTFSVLPSMSYFQYNIYTCCSIVKKVLMALTQGPVLCNFFTVVMNESFCARCCKLLPP